MFMKTNQIVELTWNVIENERVVRGFLGRGDARVAPSAKADVFYGAGRGGEKPKV